MAAADRDGPRRRGRGHGRQPVAAALRAREAGRRACEVLEEFGLGRPGRPASRASSRRACGACATWPPWSPPEPTLVLLDEPTAGLAQREVEAFAPLLRRIRDRYGASMLVVEHDMPLHDVAVPTASTASSRAGSSPRARPTRSASDPAVIASYLGTDAAAVARSGSLARRKADASAAVDASGDSYRAQVTRATDAPHGRSAVASVVVGGDRRLRAFRRSASWRRLLGALERRSHRPSGAAGAGPVAGPAATTRRRATGGAGRRRSAGGVAGGASAAGGHGPGGGGGRAVDRPAAGGQRGGGARRSPRRTGASPPTRDQGRVHAAERRRAQQAPGSRPASAATAREYIQALAAWANASGGVAGRKVVPVAPLHRPDERRGPGRGLPGHGRRRQGVRRRRRGRRCSTPPPSTASPTGARATRRSSTRCMWSSEWQKRSGGNEVSYQAAIDRISVTWARDLAADRLAPAGRRRRHPRRQVPGHASR